MSPIDDELRAALHGRAQVLSPSPDPLAGIERRARKIQRTRIGAAVAGSVLAVSAIALGVPALQSSTSSDGPRVPQLAGSPSAEPTGTPYALDPAQPWTYRGDDLSELGPGTLDTLRTEYAAKRGASDVTLTPLFGQVYEPSAQFTLFFLAEVDGELRWGVSLTPTEAGPEFPVDEPLPEPALALAAALPGDEVGRLLVVAAPDVGELQYAPDAAEEFRALTSIADGVAIGPLEGDKVTDSYRVLDRDGTEITRAAAPDVTAVEQPDGQEVPPATGAPTNVVDWPVRGQVDNALFQQALRAFARETGAAEGSVDGKVLYAGSREDRNVMLLQVWAGNEDARTFGYLEAAGNESTWLGPYTAPGPAAFGLLIPAAAVFFPNDLLLVVPEPRTGQVLYSADGRSEPRPVEDQGTEAAVLIERAQDASGDRLLVLDGNGDFDRPIYRGTVQELLDATF